MSVNLVLPPLSSWATSRLTGLLEAKTQQDFITTFDATFVAHCTFSVNGKTVSRDEYKAQLLGVSTAGFGERGTVVNIQGQTQVETGNQGQLSGLVGIFYTAVADSKFLILGAASSEKKDTSSLNLVIEPTEKNPNPNPRIHGYFDPRRVTRVNQVVAESTYHFMLPHPPVSNETTGCSKVEPGSGPIQLPPNVPGPFGGRFGPGPVILPGSGLGPVLIPPSETGAAPEMLPGDGEFGVGPVITSGETLGETKP